MRAPSAALPTITRNLRVIHFGKTRKHATGSTPKRKVAPPGRPQSTLSAQPSQSVVLPEAFSEPPARPPKSLAADLATEKKTPRTYRRRWWYLQKSVNVSRKITKKIDTTTRHTLFFSVAHPFAPRPSLVVCGIPSVMVAPGVSIPGRAHP